MSTRTRRLTYTAVYVVAALVFAVLGRLGGAFVLMSAAMSLGAISTLDLPRDEATRRTNPRT